jgi:hypothetical protein
VEGLAAVQTAVSQHFNNAWRPHAGWAASANPIRNTCRHPDHIRTLGICATHIEGWETNDEVTLLFFIVYRSFRSWLVGASSNTASVGRPRLVVLAEFRLLPFGDLQQAWRVESEQRQEL